MTPRRQALLIGIDHYPRLENADLRGCLNDVELLSSVLTERFEVRSDHLVVLRDDEATRSGIFAAFTTFYARLARDDVAIIAFAGHGSRMRHPGAGGDLVESIVPSDSGRGGHPNRDIHDWEVDRFVQRLNRKTPFVTLIFDCCHSGGATRSAGQDGPISTRGIEADLRDPAAMELEVAPPISGMDAGRPPLRRGRRQAVVVTACEADELAWEHKCFDGERVVRHGALSYFLGRALVGASAPETWRELFSVMQPALVAAHPQQHPVLEGEADRLIFSAGERPPAPHLRVLEAPAAGSSPGTVVLPDSAPVTDSSPGTVVLAGGAAHGVTPGSLFSIHPPGHSTDELAAVRIVSVGAATSRARIVRGEEAMLTSGLWASLEELRLPTPILSIRVDQPERFTAEATDLAERLRASSLLQLVDGDAELTAALVPDPGHAELTWQVVDANGRPAVRRRRDSEIGALVDDLTRTARWRFLLALENPRSRLRAPALRLRRFADGTSITEHAELVDGEKVEIEIDHGELPAESAGSHPSISSSAVPLWTSLLQFGIDGTIQLLLPRPGHPTYRPGGVRIQPGETLRLAADYYAQDPRYRAEVGGGLELRLPDGLALQAGPGPTTPAGRPPGATIFLKLMAAPQPTDFESLCQESPTRDSSSASPREMADWVTVLRSLRVRRRNDRAC